MENWQQLRNSGNQHFKEAAWLDAQYCYQQALSLIESELSQQLSDRELLFAWIAGMHNLAHLYELQQQSETALYYLKLAHKEVQTLSADESVAVEVRRAAFNSLSITIPPLLDFAKRHPICDDCLSALQETAALVGGQSAAIL
mgnify:CR=1 FL=1